MQPPGDDACRLLKSIFGYDAFRPLQSEVVHNILVGQDTLAIMPTRQRQIRSVTSFLPALRWLTVVVSPLIALMQTRCKQLREVGAPAAFLNSTVEYRDLRCHRRRASAGRSVKAALTPSPETADAPRDAVLLDRSRVACLCDRRGALHLVNGARTSAPEYRQAPAGARSLPRRRLCGFHGHRTLRVQRDIQEILGFRDANSFVASFNR